MSEVVIQAPRRGEIPRVQIADLCEGCISLSNAEGFGERLFHFSYIAWIEEIPALIDRHKTLQRIPADNRLSPDFQNRQLAPVHQFPHGVPADTRTLEQKASLLALLRELKRIFPRALIVGHHDLNPMKECPCFSCTKEYSNI